MPTSSEQRVLFITGVEEAPLRYRVYLPVEALRRLGVASEVRFHTDPDLVQLAGAAALVILFRVPASKRILELIDSLHTQRKPVVFDIDDLVFDRQLVSSIPWLKTLPPVEAEIIRRRSELLRMTMESCDGVITSTAPLRAEIEKLGLPCVEFPNGAGEQLLQLSNEALATPAPHTSFRIGYLSGTFTHQADWLLIEPAVIEFMDHHPEVELWMVGQVKNTPKLARFGERVKFLPLVPWQHLPALTRQLDVNLAPLTSGTFNECKSAIKWLEASLVQVPTIASAIPPFTDVIKQDVNGLLANSVSDWRDCLERLLSDKESRQRVASNAHNDAISEFGPERQSERYAKVLEWASSLKTRNVVSDDSVPDLPVRSHALEPFDLTLVAARVYPQLPTKNPLEFKLEFLPQRRRDVRMRLDLLFATYGGPGAAVKVAVMDASDRKLLAEATANADKVGEESWTAFEFEFELSSMCERVLLRVTSEARIALWADLAFPCFKLWAGNDVTLRETSSPAPSIFATAMARVKYARYLWRVRGAKAAWRRARQTAATNLWRRRHNS